MQSVFYLLITLAILIVVHEYGHYWVARRCGVKVLKFSIGFGKPLWKRVSKSGTEFSVSALPLGGYVKMLDEREGEVDEHLRNQAFNNKSLAARSAIVIAGPLANLLFAIFAYWLIFMIGIPGQKPIISEVELDSPAYVAQLVTGDVILEVDGYKTPTLASVTRILANIAIDGGKVDLLVSDGNSARDVELDVAQYDFSNSAKPLLDSLGIRPYSIEVLPFIASVTDTGEAKKSGIQQGDKILFVGNQQINNWMDVVKLVQASPNTPLEFTIERQQQKYVLSVTPSAGDDGIGRIGAMVDVSKTTIDDRYLAIEQYGVFSALYKGFSQTWQFSSATVKSIVGMLMGEVSSTNIGGPVTIAQYAGSSAEHGLISFMGFLAMISISLGLLNLMPIPMLDGGHLAFYLIEWLRGKPLSEYTQSMLQKIGIMLLVMLMFLAFFNDLTRLFG